MADLRMPSLGADMDAGTLVAWRLRVGNGPRGRPYRPRPDGREELDIDSMDFLKLMPKVHQAFGIEIPEADNPLLFTLDGAVGYVAGKLG